MSTPPDSPSSRRLGQSSSNINMPSAVTIAAAISTLRSEIPEVAENPERYTDEYILRFLKGKKYRIEDAKAFLQKHAQWVKEIDIPALMSGSYPEQAQVKKLYPSGYHGVDYHKRPIYIERVGYVKVHEILEVATMERLVQIFVREYEKTLWQRLKASGSDQTVTILDLSGVGFNSFKKEIRSFLGTIIGISGQNYPEILGNMYIVNAPVVFQGIWSVIKPWIDPNTRKKIVICGRNFRDILAKDLDVDKLPVFLGGTCKCNPAIGEEELHGCLYSDRGPWNPSTALVEEPHFAIEDFVSAIDVDEDDFQTCSSIESFPQRPTFKKRSRGWCFCG